jgi:hypothetical protein
MTELAVDVIGEVDGCRARRQIDDAPLRRQHVDGIGEKTGFELLRELARVAHFVLPLEDLTQPGDLFVVTPVVLRVFLVPPVGGDA